ncbi:MAG: SMP-30/gluconolactonase/LRE family protein [Acidobacteriota bacterium]|nr:SMP-30/gluconolactonase/LRE family protein [Acidobacteriota bacterium]
MNGRSLLAWLAGLALAVLVAPAAGGQAAETLVLFDHFAGETPESIRFDRSDNAYVSLAFLGQIRKITPDLEQSLLAVLPLGLPCSPGVPTVSLGLTIDRQDRLYVAVSACDPANQGIWSVSTEDGAMELVHNAPSDSVWNGIEAEGDFLYAADTFKGLVWRMPIDGSGAPEIWADDPLLAIPPGSPFPGPNGVRFYKSELYVAVSATGNIVAFPLEPSGAAGPARVHATLPFPQGCDEFAFDVHGSIYCTTDPFNTIVRLDPDGTTAIVLDATDLLDGPTSVAFGRRGTNRKNLYVTNAAFPTFPNIQRPSLMRVRLDVPGFPP